jgi:hypothetical protein
MDKFAPAYELLDLRMLYVHKLALIYIFGLPPKEKLFLTDIPYF